MAMSIHDLAIYIKHYNRNQINLHKTLAREIVYRIMESAGKVYEKLPDYHSIFTIDGDPEVQKNKTDEINDSYWLELYKNLPDE